MRTNRGFTAGPYPPYDVIVRHASPASYHPLHGIWDVPVFPARVYPGTDPSFANQLRTPSTSIAVICFDVDSFITLRIGVGTVSIFFPSG